MTGISDYFGDWKKIIKYSTIVSLMTTLEREYSHKMITPPKNLVFRAFNACPYNDLKVVMIGQDPYPQKDVATGLLFANSLIDGKVESPSLQMIKEVAIDYTIPYGRVVFDHSLESWAKQGCLLLNAALTVEVNHPGSHTMLWRPFMTGLLERLSETDTGIIYVLFGKTAQTFIPYINVRHNYVLSYEHPAYAVRCNREFKCNAFLEINSILKRNNDTEIAWYQEYE